MGVDLDPSLPYSQVLACHPTQIYEMAAYLSIFGYLRFVVKKNHQYSGQIIFEYLFLAGFVRFLVEFIRLNPTYLFGFSGAQFISIGMMGIGMFFMWDNRKDSGLAH
jgi:prolipoprotein diacylglyceryltransferase